MAVENSASNFSHCRGLPSMVGTLIRDGLVGETGIWSRSNSRSRRGTGVKMTDYIDKLVTSISQRVNSVPN